MSATTMSTTTRSMAISMAPSTATPSATASATLLLKSNLKQLRLPAMGAEFEKLAREAAGNNESYEAYLLRLTELEAKAEVAFHMIYNRVEKR